MCGTMRPTKATGPASATAAPASTSTTSRHNVRDFPTFTPSPEAASSPSESTVTRRASAQEAASAATINGAVMASVSARMPATPPAVQKVSE